MNFATSTHKRDWLFDPETLRQKHAAAQQAALEAFRAPSEGAAAEGAAPDPKKPRADCPISLEDEAQLKLFFQIKLKAICQQQQMPSKVLSCALLFFKRFYTSASVLEHDPGARVMPTAVYLACKVEEAYTSAEHLCKRMGIESGPVLRFEVPLLQGLGFDLVVHSPYRALAGLFKEFDGLRRQQSPLLDAALLAAPSERLAAVHASARATLDALMLTDAPLLQPPGLLALAALRAGCTAAGLACGQYLSHVVRRAAEQQQQQQGQGQGQQQQAGAQDAAASEQRVLAALASLDALAAAHAQVDEDALQKRATEVDRTVKLWRKAQQQATPAAAAAGGAGSAQPATVAAAVG